MKSATLSAEGEVLRLRFLLAGMLLCFLFLAVMLWREQVAHGQEHQADLVRQSVRRVRLPGMRGKIFDTKAALLADNRPSYNIALYLEELRRPGPWARTIAHVEEQLALVAGALDRPPEIDEDDIKMHIRKRLPLPLVAWRDLDAGELARWAELGTGIEGVDLIVEPVRTYPNGPMAAHVLGYVGRADIQQDEQQPYHYYLAEMEGRRGLEKRFDHLLRGEAGGRLVRVDVSGFLHDEIGVREPVTGADLMLTLDADMQRLAEEALQGRAGAAVVLNAQTGDVLALASSPSFDPNAFSPSIPSRLWNVLLNHPDKPLLSRALTGQYAPGSTFKPVVAMAALEGGYTTPDTRYQCDGIFELGRAQFDCYHRIAHGSMDLHNAIAHSCNVYFYNLGCRIGEEAIIQEASRLGLGRKSGIEVDYETSGLLPSDAWKREQRGDGWRQGDTCNLAIGQGFLAVTPLQMAVVTAALANGGRVYQPRLIKGVRTAGDEHWQPAKSASFTDMGWEQKNLQPVRDGMRAVVMESYGTAPSARVPGVIVAGKTGTAEYGRKNSGLKYGWMIAFAPFDHPRYAVAVVVERADSGGGTVGPRMGLLLKGLFELEAGRPA